MPQKKGDTVIVNPGNYSERVIISKKLILKGAGHEVTEINGAGLGVDTPCNHPVIKVKGKGVIISGFKITGGYPGIYVVGDNVLISNNNIVANKNLVDYSSGGCPTIVLESFNYTGFNGLGIFLKGNDARIINNIIVKNGETGDGEGIGLAIISAKSAKIINNTISRNSGGYGAWVGNGVGIYGKNASGTIINNIITDNDILGGGWGSEMDGHGIYLEASSFDIKFNNVWSNNRDDIYSQGSDVIIITGKGNISVNPMFVGNDNFHLTQESPCVDSGTKYPVIAVDIEGNPRPYNNRLDMGAYEFSPSN